ncbi:MAG: hypothetical protein V4668_01160 [Patescibacteria group bacterium]
MPSQSIQKRIQSLTPEYRQFILSEYLEITIDFFSKNYDLNNSEKVNFENSLLLYLLLFINKYELIELIIKNCNISISDAIYIVKTITDSLPQEMETQMSFNINLLTEETGAPIEDTIRNSTLNNASDAQLFKYFVCKTNKNLANLVSGDLSDKLAQLAGDIILGFYKIDDVIALLQQELELDSITATKVGGKIQEFLIPLSNPNWEPPVEDTEEVAELAQADRIQSTPEPVTTVREQSAIPEIRTMASDMAQERSPARTTFNAVADIDEPIYVSTQPTLERTAVSVPTYTESIPAKSDTDESRWS